MKIVLDRKGLIPQYRDVRNNNEPKTKMKNNLTYAEFEAEMARLMKRVYNYTPEQIGFEESIKPMIDLADDYPEFDAQLENE